MRTGARAGAKPGCSGDIDRSTRRVPAYSNLRQLDKGTPAQLWKDGDRTLAGYQKRKRDNALREIEAITREHDLSLKEVIQSNHSRSIKAPRFPHHENAALTWTGRGPRSAWYKEARHAGATSKDLKVA